MKKTFSILMVAFMVLGLTSVAAKAQDKQAGDYFLGKWKVTLLGLPQGNIDAIMTFELNDGKLEGNIGDGNPENGNIFSKVELKENAIVVYYNAQGYDVYMTLVKVDDDNVSGNMMDMFEIKGKRDK